MRPQNGTSRAATIQRPLLPFEHLNPYVKDIDQAKIPPVKFQEIMRDGQSTIVARMKIPTPTAHAFILRRLDTGAVSSTTMFRAAFPTATDEAERAESSWIKAKYNMSGANKSGNSRFAGTWVTSEVAQTLAQEYALTPVITPLLVAAPDPNVSFRKSSKVQPLPPVASTAAGAALSETPSVKRRREASPANSPARSQATPRRAVTPQRAPATPSSPRRSTRLLSPGVSITSSVAKVVATLNEPAASFGSDETAVEDEAQDLARVAEQNMQEDIREQKELMNRLKAEKAEAEALAQAAAVRAEVEAADDQITLVAPSISTTSSKRGREEEPTTYTLNIQEPEVTGDRQIVTNRKVRLLGEMPPERKSLAWGAFLFAAGVGAVSFLPSLPSFF